MGDDIGVENTATVGTGDRIGEITVLVGIGYRTGLCTAGCTNGCTDGCTVGWVIGSSEYRLALLLVSVMDATEQLWFLIDKPSLLNLHFMHLHLLLGLASL